MRQDWKQLTIGDVCEVVNGGTPKTNVVEFWGGPHMWITPAEMGKRTSPYVSDTERHLTDAGLNSTNLLPPYSVILSSRAPIGHLVINTVPMGTNQGCKGLVPKSTLDEKYLYYYLSSIVDLLNELGTGTTFKELSGSNLKRVPIPIPPLNEQRRIVAILDEAFAAIATATANAEKNLANARELFDAQLQSVFLGHRDEWKTWEFEDCLVTVIYPKKVQRKDFLDHGKYPVISQEADFINGYWDDPRNLFPVARPVVIFGDHTRVLKYVDFDFVLGADGVKILKPQEFLFPKFFYYLLKSLPIESVGYSRHYKFLKALTVSAPHLDKQEEIVVRIDALASLVEETVSINESRQRLLTELKQSILEGAFTGELAGAGLKGTKAAAE